MKKYLMTGVAALAMCAAFTSCSHEITSQEEIQAYGAEKIVKDYEAAFIATFGQPAANHDWGFGTVSKARTRYGNTGDTYAATHQYTSDGQAFEEGQTVTGTVVAGANMNHNEWADPNKEFGGWVVPPALTKEQKDLVTRYFQTVNDMSFEDPQLRHFFVQQVYKGGKVDAGKVNNTTEGITAANGSKYDSDNMNLLTVGHYNSHINDFNAGTCSESDVLDNNQKVGGTSHKDQITLMVNVDDTSCFGYHETGSSTHHNDKAALVSWETISKWAGIYGTENDILNDGWDRSFVGFDLAIKEGAQAYATDNAGNVLYADFSQAPGNPIYAWDGEKVVQISTGAYESVQVGNEWSTWTEQRLVYKDGYKTMNVGWLTTNKNFYVAADAITLNQTSNSLNGATIASQDWDTIKNYVVFEDAYVEGAQNSKAKVLNLQRINELIADGYLPVKDKNLTEWIQVGTSDGYYSDWIVTLTEAKRIVKEEYDIRVIAEDLNAKAEEGDIENSDWDFNDVVFDVKFTGDNSAVVTLVAAGGTLPLIVGVVNPTDGQAYPENEVHSLFGVDVDYMVNTNAEKKHLKGGAPAAGHEAPTIDITITGVKAANGKNIPIYVEKMINGQKKWIEMKAKEGQPAAKIGVKHTFKYCDERQKITTKYPLFYDWVNNPDVEWYKD